MKTLTRNDLEEILDEKEFTYVVLTCDDCLSAKEKADRLNRSIDTVNTYMKRIFKKLEISKVTELSKIYFTSIILFVMFSLHGLVEDEIRTRTRRYRRKTEIVSTIHPVTVHGI